MINALILNLVLNIYRLKIDDQLVFKCLKYNKNNNKEFNKDLVKRFASTYKFCDKDSNKFTLLLKKDVYPYEYISTWERFD